MGVYDCRHPAIAILESGNDAVLYTSKADIVGFKNPEELAEKYNNVLYHRHCSCAW